MLTVFWKKLEAKSHNSVTETTVLQIHKINETYYVPRPLVLYNEICLCSDDTLSFGYAPKEVIDRFGSFCSKYATTASAIDGLLELKKNLKYMYEFLCDSVTCEMLLKLPSNENIRRLREAVYSLCEHTASMRYDDFNSSIEEIAMQLDSLQTPDALCTITEHSDVDVDNSNNEKATIESADRMHDVCEGTKKRLIIQTVKVPTKIFEIRLPMTQLVVDLTKVFVV